MLVTLVHELRRRGGGIGVAAMCAGGGMGSASRTPAQIEAGEKAAPEIGRRYVQRRHTPLV